MYIISFTFFYSTRFLAFASFLRWCYYNKQVYQLISLNQQKKLAQKMFSHQRINLRVFIKFQCIACINRFHEYNGFMFIIAWFNQIWIIYDFLIPFGRIIIKLIIYIENYMLYFLGPNFQNLTQEKQFWQCTLRARNLHPCSWREFQHPCKMT